MQTIIDTITGALAWLLDVLLWLPRKVLGEVLDAVLGVVESIEVPQWLAAIPGLYAEVPSGVWYWLHVAAFREGVLIVLSALTLRFIVRRLPVIG